MSFCPLQRGSRDCIVTYLKVGAYESHDSPLISESSYLHISNLVWCQRLMILLSFSGSKTVPVIFLVCQKAGVILTTITCNPILLTLLCAIYIYIYIYIFLHKENSLELNIALVLCRGGFLHLFFESELFLNSLLSRQRK